MSSGFDDNPFADPSVMHATNGGGAAPPAPPNPGVSGDGGATLEEYNPFDKQKTNAGGGGAPAVMSPAETTAQAPPAYAASAQQQITTADFQRRQEELEQRAKELERREAELRNAPYNARANNWPPIPSFCPLQPCFYQDISVDIPVEFQKVVTYLYYLWVANAGLLFANAVIGLLYLLSGGDLGGTFLLATIYLFLFTPASFLCWFRPAYKAFRDDSSFNFMVFFFVFFFQFLMSLVAFLGVGRTGSCGLILGVSEIGAGESGFRVFVGILMLAAALGFGVLALANFLILVRVHKLYRGTGGSMAKAQAEFASGVMKNETVRQAAAEAAQAQVRNTFAGQQQQQPQQQQGGRF